MSRSHARTARQWPSLTAIALGAVAGCLAALIVVLDDAPPEAPLTTPCSLVVTRDEDAPARDARHEIVCEYPRQGTGGG